MKTYYFNEIAILNVCVTYSANDTRYFIIIIIY